jgi:hypothetical protein
MVGCLIILRVSPWVILVDQVVVLPVIMVMVPLQVLMALELEQPVKEIVVGVKALHITPVEVEELVHQELTGIMQHMVV